MELERVDFDRRDLTESYENGPNGLEQRLVLLRRPDANGEEVVLQFRLEGASAAPDADRLRLGHGLVLRDLAARDAKGASVPASFDALAIVFGGPPPVWRTSVIPLAEPIGSRGIDVFAVSLGDFDGDGHADFMAAGGIGCDEIWVYPGRAGGFDDTARWSIFVDPGDETDGLRLASTRDINHDGYADFLVGMPLVNQVLLFLGSPFGIEGRPAWTADAPDGATRFGDSLAFAGDVDGDGAEDVLVGAPCDGRVLPSGSVHLYAVHCRGRRCDLPPGARDDAGPPDGPADAHVGILDAHRSDAPGGSRPDGCGCVVGSDGGMPTVLAIAWTVGVAAWWRRRRCS